MSNLPQPNTQQLLLVAMHREAAAAIDQLVEVATKHGDKQLRSEAIHWIARIGTRAGIRLHELAKNPLHRDEVLHAAAREGFWPKVIAAHKADQDEFDAVLSADLVGAAKLSLGNASLDTLQVRWAWSFLQQMELGKVAWQRTGDAETANRYLTLHHNRTLDPADITLASDLPPFSSESIDRWSEALKVYLHRHFPNHGLGSHPEWLHDAGRRKSRDGVNMMRGDPKELHRFAVGRVGEALRQLVKRKQSTRRRRKLVARKRRN